MRLILLCLFVLPAYAQVEVEIGSPAYWERVRARCGDYGFTPGTVEFKNCVMQLDQNVRQRQIDRENMILQQGIQNESVRQQRALPLCSQLGPGMRGYMQAQGRCR